MKTPRFKPLSPVTSALEEATPRGMNTEEAEENIIYNEFCPRKWRRKGIPLQYSCLENPVDRGALVGCCPWGHTESNMTEAT